MCLHRGTLQLPAKRSHPPCSRGKCLLTTEHRPNITLMESTVLRWTDWGFPASCDSFHHWCGDSTLSQLSHKPWPQVRSCCPWLFLLSLEMFTRGFLKANMLVYFYNLAYICFVFPVLLLHVGYFISPLPFSPSLLPLIIQNRLQLKTDLYPFKNLLTFLW